MHLGLLDGGDAVEEVRIAAEAVSVLTHLILQPALLLEVVLQLGRVESGLDDLQLVKQDLVFIDYSRQTSDPIRPVQRSVRV